jgi:biopolymer transport protein TolR
MGSLVPNGSGGRRGSRRRPLADINVTPFVDVMLVLLVIFMATATLLVPGVPVDLPKTKAQALAQDQEPLTITVKKDGRIYLQDKAISPADLAARTAAIAKIGYDQRIFVRGDSEVAYGRVVEVMGILHEAGFTKVGLVTGPPPAQKPDEK